MPDTITDMGDAVVNSLSTALENLVGFLPQLLGAIVVLVIGWIISSLLARLVERVLRTIGFERASHSSGIHGFLESSGAGEAWTASRIVAEIVKWFIRLIAIQAAAQILGMTQITAIINEILLFLPNLVVAIVIIVVGAMIAKFVAGLVRGAVTEMGFANANLMAVIARYAIIVVAVIAAVNQLGVAETVVNTLFIGVVAAIAAASALAFGLGGQQIAARIWQGWYQQGQAASQKVSRYAQQKEAEQEAIQTSPGEAGPAPTAGGDPADQG